MTTSQETPMPDQWTEIGAGVYFAPIGTPAPTFTDLPATPRQRVDQTVREWMQSEGLAP